MATLEGSTFALARWFQTEKYANRPEDDFVRDEILNDLARATAVAITDGTVLVETAIGAAMIDRVEVDGAPLIVFDYVRHDRWERTKFWMNASSVVDLGNTLRDAPRRPFDEMFVGARAK